MLKLVSISTYECPFACASEAHVALLTGISIGCLRDVIRPESAYVTSPRILIGCFDLTSNLGSFDRAQDRLSAAEHVSERKYLGMATMQSFSFPSKGYLSRSLSSIR